MERTIAPSAKPIPMQYRGLSSGNRWVHWLTLTRIEVAQLQHQETCLHAPKCICGSGKQPANDLIIAHKPFSSPPLSPPMLRSAQPITREADCSPIANPATLCLRSIICVRQRFLSSMSSPPCTIAKRFWVLCFPDRWWWAMHLSSHRTERSMASSTLLRSGVRLDTGRLASSPGVFDRMHSLSPTSSSCMIMSAPMACCVEMLSSGYEYVNHFSIESEVYGQLA
jgi:hypothetical protein